MPTPGYYLGNLKSISFEKVGEKGTPACVLRYVITDETVQNEWVPVADPFNRSVNLFLSEKAAPASLAKLKALGWNEQMGPSALLADKYMTDQTMLAMVMENGYERWSIHDLKDIGGYVPEALSETEQRALRARLGLGAGAGATRPSAAPPRPVPPAQPVATHIEEEPPL